MRRIYHSVFAAAIALALTVQWTYSQLGQPGLSGGSGSNVLPGASVDYWFANGQYFGCGAATPPCVTTTRTTTNGTATDLLPTSVAGATYATYANNTPRINTFGLLQEEARVNHLLNSAAPATQTTGNLATGTYTLWVNGSGSATMSAGTATGCGTGTATQGNPVTVTITVLGTCTVTVAGSLNAFQFELGSPGTSLIITTAAIGSRASDVTIVTSPPGFGVNFSTFAQGIPHFPITFGTAQNMIDITDGTTANRALLARIATSGLAQFQTIGSSVANASIGTVVLAQNTATKTAAAFSSGDQAIVVNGGTPNTGTGVNVPAGLTVVGIGSRFAGGLQTFNGYIARIALWPTSRISNATMQSITAP